MKILLVLNKPNREMPIMLSIKREILKLAPDSEVQIREMCSAGFNRFVFAFRPNVILTFPFTAEGFAQPYYLFKLLIGAKIVTLRAEGVMDFKSEYSLQFMTGFDSYGSRLVDYELFWGPRMADVVGRELLRQGKLSDVSRVRVVGYPRLEGYFDESLATRVELPPRIAGRLTDCERSRVLLFITGFHLANYSRQNLFDAKDLNAEERVDELLVGVECSRRFRASWIDALLRTARENPDALLIVKKHPNEKQEDYQSLTGSANILFVYEDIPLEHLVPYCRALFHYGSTALADAYLSGIPAIYVFSPDNGEWYNDLGWPSSARVKVEHIPVAVHDLLASPDGDAPLPDTAAVLYEQFNIEPAKPYTPSRNIASLLLALDPPQRLSLSDRHLLKAILIAIGSPFYWRGVILKNRIRQLASRAARFNR